MRQLIGVLAITSGILICFPIEPVLLFGQQKAPSTQLAIQQPPSDSSTPKSNVPIVISVVSVLISTISLYLVTRGHRISEKALRAKIAWDALELMEGKDGENSGRRALLEGLLKKAKDNGDKSIPQRERIKQVFLNAPESEVSELYKLARTFDKAGHLVKYGCILVPFLFDFYSRPIAIAWLCLEPMINALRETRVQPGHMMQFEILATGAALYRKSQPQHFGDSDLFDIHPEIEARWNRWKKTAWMK